MKHHPSAAGFTLVELLVTVALAAILLAIAAPSFEALMASNRLTTKTNELLTSLTLARSEAIRKGHRVVICKSTDKTSCATTGDWSPGWVVFEDINSNGSKDTDEPILAAYADDSSIPKASGTTGVASQVWFSPDGRAGATGTIRICHTSKGLNDNKRARDIAINLTGRTSKSEPASISNSCPDPS